MAGIPAGYPGIPLGNIWVPSGYPGGPTGNIWVPSGYPGVPTERFGVLPGNFRLFCSCFVGGALYRTLWRDKYVMVRNALVMCGLRLQIYFKTIEYGRCFCRTLHKTC